MCQLFFVVVLCLYCFVSSVTDAEFFNPKPIPPPAAFPRLQYVSRIADMEIRRIENAIRTQGLEVTEVIFYGTDIVVTKNACPGGASGDCYIASFKNTFPGVENPKITTPVNDAFTQLARQAINMGLVRPNRVKGGPRLN